MERPRLSVSSSSSSEDSASLPPPALHPQVYPPMTVDSIVVNKGGTGVLHGSLNTFTVNQYIVPNGDDWDPGVVKDLVTDAVRISTDTNNKFFPSESSCTPGLTIAGKKEDLEGLQRRWCYLITALVSLSFITLVSTSVFSLFNFQKSSMSPASPTGLIPVEDTSSQPADLPGAPRMMGRAAWVAMPPTSTLDNNTLPIQRVVVCHTATEGCETSPDCILEVRYVQQFHVESRKWSDIGYNFLVGGDGCVYVGRGWDKMGAHTKGFNNGTLGIAFIGTYISKMPNEMQLEAFNKLVDLGVRIGKISANYTLVSQCQLQVTAAPGLVLATNMTSWPHYDSSLSIKCHST